MASGLGVRLFLLFVLFVAGALIARPANAAELAILSNGFSIRHEHRLTMGATTRLYLSTDDSSFTDVPTASITGYEKDLSIPAAPVEDRQTSGAPAASARALKPSAKAGPAIPLNDVVNTASATYHLDPDLVNSVIHAESGFNPHAVSPKGARGLMQLMPNTASQMGVNDIFDPAANVDGGSRYLRELLERYNFDLVKALAAYNAGPQRVEQYQGVPPFRETRAYVAKIVHDYNKKKIAQEKAEAKQKRAARHAAPTVSKSEPTSSTIAAQSAH
jgi:soluble lytic murein transglycosylase-like protein